MTLSILPAVHHKGMILDRDCSDRKRHLDNRGKLAPATVPQIGKAGAQGVPHAPKDRQKFVAEKRGRLIL